MIFVTIGSQNLGYSLYDMRDRGDVQKDVLPISKESTLKWLGFSEEGVNYDIKFVRMVHTSGTLIFTYYLNIII